MKDKYIMNKRGDAKELLFEISFITFAALVGLVVLLYVNSSTKDIGFQAKVYSKDIELVLNAMQNSEAAKIKTIISLPSEFEFILDDKYIYIKSKEISIKEEYVKKPNVEFKFERTKDLLISEKNEIA